MYVAELSGNCIAALLLGRILNSIMLDGGITNAAERALQKHSKLSMNNAG